MEIYRGAITKKELRYNFYLWAAIIFFIQFFVVSLITKSTVPIIITICLTIYIIREFYIGKFPWRRVPITYKLIELENGKIIKVVSKEDL